MAKDYSQYKARINAIECIDNALTNLLENYQRDYEYYAALHDEQPEDDWVLKELHNANYQVAILTEVIKWFEKTY